MEVKKGRLEETFGLCRAEKTLWKDFLVISADASVRLSI